MGAACRSTTLGENSRMILRSIARARRDSISCPQSARRSASATVGLRDRVDAEDALALKVRDRSAQQPIVLEPAQELGVVIVEREHPAHPLDRALAPTQKHGPIRELLGRRLLAADDRAQDTVSPQTRRVARTAGREGE